MKKILIFLVLLISANSLYSQKLDTIFNGYLTPIVRTGGTAPEFNFKAVFRNNNLSSNGFDTTGVKLNILVATDGNCYKLPVTQLTSIPNPVQANDIIEGTVIDSTGELSTIPTGMAAIYAETDSLLLAPYIFNLSEDLRACVITDNFIKLDKNVAGSGVENTIIRNDSVFIVTTDGEFYSGINQVGSDSLAVTGPILRTPSTNDTLPTTTSSDWISWWYFQIPSITNSFINGSTFEIGTSNSVTYRSVLNNPAATSVTNYLATASGKGTAVTYADGSQTSRTNDFDFTYAPVQTPAGGVGVWDSQSYTFQSSLDYSGSGESGSVTSSNRTIRGVYPILYGMVADTATAFADPYGTMNKLVQSEGNKTVSYTGTGLIFYGFPQTWSDTNLE